MKVITTNLLNRFWKNGIQPIRDALTTKISTTDIVNDFVTTVAGKVADARALKTLKDGQDELNRNNGYKTEFKLVEKSSNYVLPKFTHICTVYAQVEGLTSTQSIIGSQESASSVIGAKIGTNQFVNIQKNSANNAYVANTNSGTGARLMIMYI